MQFQQEKQKKFPSVFDPLVLFPSKTGSVELQGQEVLYDISDSICVNVCPVLASWVGLFFRCHFTPFC